MTTQFTAIVLMYFFILKHFLVDYIIQTPAAKQNKYLSNDPGGVYHAIQHGVLTYLILMVTFGITSFIIYIAAILDFVVHYIIDWFMTRVVYKNDSSTDKVGQKNILEGFDDVLHYLTYVCLILLCYLYV